LKSRISFSEIVNFTFRRPSLQIIVLLPPYVRYMSSCTHSSFLHNSDVLLSFSSQISSQIVSGQNEARSGKKRQFQGHQAEASSGQNEARSGKKRQFQGHQAEASSGQNEARSGKKRQFEGLQLKASSGQNQARSGHKKAILRPLVEGQLNAKFSISPRVEIPNFIFRNPKVHIYSDFVTAFTRSVAATIRTYYLVVLPSFSPPTTT
jgi:hypothetical protein